MKLLTQPTGEWQMNGRQNVFSLCVSRSPIARTRHRCGLIAVRWFYAARTLETGALISALRAIQTKHTSDKEVAEPNSEQEIF